jgi:PPOX class probable F420-dependent enzyme
MKAFSMEMDAARTSAPWVDRRLRPALKHRAALPDARPSGTLDAVQLPESARRLIESDSLAHLVTLNRDGSAQVSCVWVGLDGDEIVSGHLVEQQKLRNVARDPRVVLSVEGTEIQPPGLKQYLVVHGHARVVPGGAPELLQRLAHVYLGPDVVFPPMEGPPPGHVLRITVERLGGVGPWMA